MGHPNPNDSEIDRRQTAQKKKSLFSILTGFVLFFMLFFTNQMNFRGSHVIASGNVDLQVFVKLGVLAGTFALCLMYYKNVLRVLPRLPVFMHGVLLVFLLCVTALPHAFGFYSFYTLATLIIMFFVTIVFTSRFGIDKMMYYYLISMSIFCVFCLVFYYLVPSIGRYAYWEGGVYLVSTRMSGISGHPNSLGFLCAVASLAFVHLFMTRYPMNKLLYLGFVLVLLCLVLTNSRTSLGGMILMVGLYSALHLRLFPVAVLGVVLLSAFILLSVELSWGIVPELMQMISRSGKAEEITSLTGRSHVWDSLFMLIEKRPVLGWGYARIGAVLAEHRDEIGFEAGQAHNLYLQLLFSGGFVGLFLYILNLIIALMLSIVRVVQGGSPLVFCILFYFIFASFTETIMMSNVASGSYMIFIMCLVSLSQNKTRNEFE